MAFIDSLAVFLVSLAIGALGIHLATQLVFSKSNYTRSIITALVGSIIWGIVSFFVGGIPLLGPALALLAWIAVINFFYPGGWADAAAIGLLAWILVSVVLFILATLGITAFDAIGIPMA